MNRKLFLSFLAAGSTTGVALYSFPKPNSPEDEANLIPTSSTDPTNVIKIGNVSKTLHELLKEYLKTVTGARNLSNFLAASLAVDFIDSRSTNTSALGDRFKNELSTLRSNYNVDSLGKEERKKALFEAGEDPDLHRRHHVLSDILRKFPEILSDYLKDSIKDNTLNNSESSDQTIRDLGEFLDHVLDDYIEVEKPLMVKKITWKYDTSGIESKIKGLFDANDLPEGITLPTSGSYFFPLFSEDTESKFSKFIKELQKDSPNFSELSDESRILHIFPLSSSGTSNQTIALLELMGHAMTFKQWNESNKGTTSDNLSTKYNGNNKNICDNGNSTKKIPTISHEDLANDDTNNKLSRVFCVEKDKNPFKTQSPSSDFFYLKKKNETGDKPNGWIVFKDIHGVHAMSLDLDLTSDDLKQATKKKLLLAAKGTNSSEHQWNINSILGSHLRKHFVRLFLEKYVEISKKIETNGKTEFNEISSKLVEVLQADLHTESLRTLRANILGDFSNTTTQKPIEVNGSFKYINPSLGWAGKLPHKPGDKFLVEQDPKFKDHKLVFDYYEKLLLANFQKLTEDNISINPKFSKTAEPSTFKEKIDPLFASVNSSKSDKGNFYSITKETTATNTKFKNLNITSLLDVIWISGLRDNTIIDHLIQTQIKDPSKGKLTFYNWDENSKDFKDSGSIDNKTTETLFDSETNNENLFKSIIKNHLLNKYLNKFISSPDIHVDAPDGTIDLSTLTTPDNLLNLLKKVDKHQRKVFSSTFSDLLSSDNRELFIEDLTLQYLSSNKLKNFRKHLRKKMSRTNISGFIFSRKFETNEFCRPHTDKPTETDAKNLKMELGKSWDLNNKYLGYTDNHLSSFNCISKSDLFNFSSVKLPKDDGTGKAESFTNLAGHRGLYSENMKDILPQEIVDLISQRTMVWKSPKSLKNHILSIKTEEELNALIKRLKIRFPNMDWTIVEKDTMVEISPVSYDWKSLLSRRIDETGEKITFENRRRILLNFLGQSQSNGELYNSNHSRKTLRERQQNLLQENKNQKIQLFGCELFKRHYGWVTGKDGGYLIEDSNKNKHSVFFIQLKYDDLEDETSWTAFLKEMSSDLIVKELIKASKDKDAQRLALTHHLMEDKKTIDGFTVHDERIKEKLEFGWIK